MGKTLKSTEYFAAADTEEIAGILSEKCEEWINYITTTAHHERMSKSWNMYYGLSESGSVASSKIRQVGPKGEYALMNCNHFRNHLQHILVLTTAQRPALECRGANTDSATMEQCELGNQLIEWYLREKKVDRFLKNACEYGLFLTEGYVGMDWEPTMGNIYGMRPDGSPIYEGDVQFQNYTPINVIKDPHRNDTLLPWAIAIRWKNKWNLAAKYPEKAQEIADVDPEKMFKYREEFLNQGYFAQNDLIPEFVFYHEKCEALPQGRIVKYLGKDLKVTDAGLPYTKVPLFRCSPADQADTPNGYSPAFDLLGPQDALNLLDSVTLTNQKSFGVGTIIAPEGHNMKYQRLADGLNFVTANEKNGQVRVLNLTQTPAEIFKFREGIANDMELLSGVNSVLRGQPDAQITSGSFAALVASQAIQFNSGIQQSYAYLCEDVGGMLIEMLQRFAKTERVAKIVGKNKQYMLQSFSSKDIQDIKTVVVDIANPLTKTNAGKLKMVEDLINMGQIKRMDQYISVLETGRADATYENEQTSLNNIRRENELMRQGGKPSVMATDDHAKHILEHTVLADDPQARMNPTIMQALTDHMMEHIQVWQGMSMQKPELLMALGRQPLMPPQPMGMPGQPPSGNTPQMMDASQVPEQALPSQPGMPTNPQTGEKFEPIAGPINQAMAGGV